jgi:hypothetical protein
LAKGEIIPGGEIEVITATRNEFSLKKYSINLGGILMDWFTQSPKSTKILIVSLVVILFVGCCAIVGLVSWVRETQATGVGFEQRLGTQYLDNQNELSKYISGFYEQAGVLEAQTDALDQILLDAVKGRYDEGGFAAESPFFAAIFEAYPEASAAQLMDNYGALQDYITAGRESYANKQTKLLDILRAYDTWRFSGLARPFLIRLLGFPSENLKARVGDFVFTGQSAVDKMYAIVLTERAVEAYEDGRLDPLQYPGTDLGD